MKSKCDRCNGELNLVYGNEPWSPDHLICIECDSTYVIDNDIAKNIREARERRARGESLWS